MSQASIASQFSATLRSAKNTEEAFHGSILLVEDETFVREVTAEILELVGYQVLKARSAVEGIRMYRQHKGAIDLLVVDVVLPGKNGREMATELMHANPGLKTVFISGYPENVVNRNRDLPGRAVYLPKPFSVAALMQKIGEAIAVG